MAERHHNSTQRQGVDGLLVGGTEMGELMRSYDWEHSALGPVHTWPPYLRTAVNILLESRYPMYIAWGPDFLQFYNDGYLPIMGSAKHPAALASRTRDTFAEIWQFIGPMFQEVMRSGRPTYLEDQLLPLDRNGYIEECYFTFCYSALRTETLDIGGVFVTCSETTARVLGERRLRTLRDLGAAMAPTQDLGDAVGAAAAVLGENPADVPFCLIYLVQDGEATLAAAAGIDAAHSAAPSRIRLDGTDDGGWPLREAIRDGAPAVVRDIARRFGHIPARSWDVGVDAAAVIPIRGSGPDQSPDAVLILGLSPRLTYEGDYQSFTLLAAGQLAASVASAHAYAQARRRALALAELDRAKTTFFSNVSHEFRTPLTLMLGPIEDLLRSPAHPLAPEDRDRVELVQRNGFRLLKLVNSLLDFARIEAGRVQAFFEPVDLSALTTDLASAFRAAMESAGLRLVVACKPLGEPVFVDPTMWEKIVLNLVSNAFKFTFEGEVRVTLSRTPHGNSVTLTVADTGVGIPAEDLPRVFERFHRVEGTRARTVEGSGIGLALVQELTRLHGGSVAVSSTGGHGTTFTVQIPLGTAHLPAEQVRSAPSGTNTASGAMPFVEEALRWLPDNATTPTAPLDVAVGSVVDRFGGARPRADRRPQVLVVDDNADMRAYLARLLQDLYEVQVAKDGSAALECIRRDHPDLVISDVMMPGLDGFELIKAIRAEASTAATPVILLSARAGEESTIEGLSGGADDYLAKPFSARELLARVRAHLDFGRALREERSRLLAMFDQSPSFIAVLRGPDHVFEVANSAYLAVVGRQEIIGKSVLEALPEIAGQGFTDLLDSVYRTGVPYIGREVLVRLARSHADTPEDAYVDFVYYPMREPDGRISGVFAHGVDVTAQVRARKEMEALYHTVKEANDAKREFLAAMSHELRTPLNAVIGYADLLALGVRGGITDEQRQDVERIRSAGEYLLTLITDILNFSRVEAGQVELRPAPVAVARVLARASELVQPHIEARGIRFEIDDTDTRLFVLADNERLQQILLNLLMNAAKFTPGGGSIRLWTEADGDTVLFHVEDTGCGIADDQLERIFEAFVQLARSADPASQKGLGLGLAISRELARRMGGDLTARSSVGAGSCFTVTLPSSGANLNVP